MTQSNSLRRLENILHEAVTNGAKDQNAAIVLLNAMNLEPELQNTVYFYELLSKAKEDAKSLKSLQRIERYIKVIEELNIVFIKHHIYGSQWNTFTHHIESGNVLNTLDTLANYLHSQQPKIILEQDFLTNLNSEFEEFAISTMITRILSNSLSTSAQAKLLAILATLLQHPDPLIRIDILRRCVSLPVADAQRHLQQPLIQRLTSAFPDESFTAAQAFFCNYSGADGEVVAATVQKILPDRQIQTTINALQSQAQWRLTQLLPTIRLVLAVLATDGLVSSLRWKLAIGSFLS